MRNSNVPAEASAFRILLIDDNRQGLAARKAILEEIGYNICTASSPEDGLAEFASSRFDLVITDYKMPKMNGTEVIARIREVKPELPIILISGMVDPLGLNEANTGADVVIAKNSVEVSHLVRSVKRLLAKPAKKPVRSQAAQSRARSKSV
jgi:CheY-like chemotaxis protein